MGEDRRITDWIPLINKLVWPFFIVILLLVFNQEAGEVYNIILKSIKSGRSVEIGGFLKLGEAAKRTEIRDLTTENISIKAVGGHAGAIRKGSELYLMRLKRELRNNPSKTINTLILSNGPRYSVDLLKQYISTLGLQFVVFQHRGKFDGWIPSSTFVAQLPREDRAVDYYRLKDMIVGINKETVEQNASVMTVLEKMQKMHTDSIPVIDSNKNWLFFANRGEILTRLLTTIILEKHV